MEDKTVITNLTDDNKYTYLNGVTYIRLSNNFTDSINVYDNSKKRHGRKWACKTWGDKLR